ncbi:hypothetical protein B0T26DRAFT_676617 [Lasiosphaeria miniovina]|uniref:Uncharacterized protein n=1 Tax=Lasiosphaeria miniovina TaxID=1954250 RepID=A0AA40AMD2_9PEZI|nr:uncharacterized protein B0T26DRAFT_676617 [Lasiosphaeria miniovina]KAK0718449.1 hypothetical protein B0T26DRAFT_676617 [Lasiosphaeria miniovina]
MARQLADVFRWKKRLGSAPPRDAGAVTPANAPEEKAFDPDKKQPLNFDELDHVPASPFTPGGKKVKLKRVASHRKLNAVFFIVKFHILALTVTFVLVGLYATGFVWGPPGPSQDMLSALQFAAKVHEGLIILSVSNILLHRVRYLLISQGGVPLGLITSPWQISSPLYLVSSEFWGSAMRDLTGLTHLSTLVLILVCLFISLAIGPFSAIVILPQPGIYLMQSSFPGMKDYFTARSQHYQTKGVDGVPGSFRPYNFAVNSSTGLYPTSVGPDLGMVWGFTDFDGYASWFNTSFDDIILQSLTKASTGSFGISLYDSNISTDRPCSPMNITTSTVWSCQTGNKDPITVVHKVAAVSNSTGSTNSTDTAASADSDDSGDDSNGSADYSIDMPYGSSAAKDPDEDENEYEHRKAASAAATDSSETADDSETTDDSGDGSSDDDDISMDSSDFTDTTVSISTSGTVLPFQVIARDLSDRFQWHVDTDRFIDFIYTTATFSDPSGRPVAVKQPLAAVQCREGHYARSSFGPGSIVNFVSGIYPPFNITVDEAMAAMVWGTNASAPAANATFLKYFDMQPYVSKHAVSTGIVTVAPYYDDDSGAVMAGWRAVQLCYSAARWVESEIWVTPDSDASSYMQLKSPIETLINETERVSASEIIRFDSAWMQNFSNPQFDGSRMQNVLDSNLSNYDFLAGACSTDSGCLSIAISAMMMEVLTLVQCAFTPCWSYSDDIVPFAPFNYTRQRPFAEAEATGGYVNITIDHYIAASGYSLQNGTLVILGLALLLFHALIAIGHILFIAFGGFWSSDAWGQLGELLVLALNSSAPRLLRTNSAGVRHHATWQLTASVREKVEGGVELTINSRRNRKVDEDSDMEEGASSRDSFRPKADKKYG